MRKKLQLYLCRRWMAARCMILYTMSLKIIIIIKHQFKCHFLCIHSNIKREKRPPSPEDDDVIILSDNDSPSPPMNGLSHFKELDTDLLMVTKRSLVCQLVGFFNSCENFRDVFHRRVALRRGSTSLSS